MTKFESIGVERQYASASKYEADKNMKISCDCCCHKGMRIDCDRCAISFAHSLVVATFEKGGENA